MSKPFAFLLIAWLSTASFAVATETPPTISVFGGPGCVAPSTSAWAFTVTPAPIGGFAGEIWTTSISSVYILGSGYGEMSTGNLVLQAGQTYTFGLSDAYGGSYVTGDPSTGGYDAAFYDNSTHLSPGWIASNKNSPIHAYVTPSDYQNVQFTYQVNPQMTANIEDSSQNPPIVSYVALYTKANHSTIPISIDLVAWLQPYTGILALLGSSRGNVDTFSNSSDTAEPSGAFYTTVTTQQPTPSVTIQASTYNVNNTVTSFTSLAYNFLPAKYHQQFRCTIYYTPIESGFTASLGFKVHLKAPEGINTGVKYEADFLNAVMQEGFGRLTTAVNGKSYLGYTPPTKNANGNIIAAGYFYYAMQPVGNSSNPLVPFASCAVHNHVFPASGKLTTEATSIQSTFGNQTFTIADVGAGVKPEAIDLYYKEDNPHAGHVGSDGKGHGEDISRPNSTSYTENDGTPVVLTTYQPN